MLRPYTLKASLILADTTADSHPCSFWSKWSMPLQCHFLSFIPEVERNGDLPHFIEFLFLNVKNNLIPDAYNNIPAFLPPSLFKPPWNLGDGTGWQDSFNYPRSQHSSLPWCLQGTPLWKVLYTHKHYIQIEAENKNKMSAKPPLKKLITNTSRHIPSAPLVSSAQIPWWWASL